jgi:tetratricopeptide (TPR) repeat protein
MRAFKGVPDISAFKRSVLAAVVAAVVAAGFIGYTQYAARQEAARRQAFEERASAANALVGQGKFEEAIPALKAALEQAPRGMMKEKLTVANNLAGAYTTAGRMAEAKQVLEAARRDTESIPETTLNQPEFRRERVRLLQAMGNILLAEGKLPESEALLRRAVKLWPENGTVHANLANVLFLQGKFAESDTHYDHAVARQPENAETLSNWGIMLLNYKHPEDAEKRFLRALKIDSKQPKYYHGLGLALRAQARFEPALQAQHTALYFQPKMVDAMLEIADIHAQLKDFQESEKYLRAVIDKEVDPKNLHAIQALARLLAGTAAKNPDNLLEAAELLQQAVELTKEQDVNLLTQLADILALQATKAEPVDKPLVFAQAREMIDLAIKRAREQKLSPADIEILLQHRQQYLFMEHPPVAGTHMEDSGGAREWTTAGDPLGQNPKPVDPYDAPRPPPKSFSPTNLFTPP